MENAQKPRARVGATKGLCMLWERYEADVEPVQSFRRKIKKNPYRQIVRIFLFLSSLGCVCVFVCEIYISSGKAFNGDSGRGKFMFQH